MYTTHAVKRELTYCTAQRALCTSTVDQRGRSIKLSFDCHAGRPARIQPLSGGFGQLSDHSKDVAHVPYLFKHTCAPSCMVNLKNAFFPSVAG